MLASPKVQRSLLGLLVALLAAIAAVLVVDRATRSPSARPAADVTAFDGNALPNVRAPNFTLTDQDGRRLTLSRDRGHVVLIAWIHSLCRNSCPFMVEQIKGALNLLPHDGRGVDVIAVSVAPREDTVRHRRRFLAQHEMTGRMRYLNGPPAAMRRVWKDYAIQPVTPKADHSAFVFLISKSGREQIGFPSAQLTSGALAHDVRVLQRRRA